jgi:hypothetical protein
MTDSPVVLRWSAYEHEHIQRGSDWFWALGIAAISIAITSVLFHNFLFAVLILVAALALALLANKPPDLAQFEISSRGIRVNDTLHRYDDIISFWVEEEKMPHRPLLLVDTTKPFAPNLIIPMEHVDAAQVRSFLQQHTKETPMKEPIAHKILEFFGL